MGVPMEGEPPDPQQIAQMIAQSNAQQLMAYAQMLDEDAKQKLMAAAALAQQDMQDMLSQVMDQAGAQAETMDGPPQIGY
jgi:hypothetical protein